MKALLVIGFAAFIIAVSVLLIVPRFTATTSAKDSPERSSSESIGDRISTGLGGLFNTEPSLNITGPDDEQLAQGKSYDITWEADGLDKVDVIAAGNRTDFTGAERGRFNIVIAKGIPASDERASWKVPFVDAAKFRVIIRGYNRDGKQTVKADKLYLFRPDIFENRTEDGIYIDVRKEMQQRLYVLKDNKLTRAYLTSGSRSNEYLSRNNHPKTAHDHDGVFTVADKHELWHSRLFDVDMYWAMRYWGGHFIHGTDTDVYDQLGTPASSGCNRLTKEQAKELYDMTPVGTRVEIIAK